MGAGKRSSVKQRDLLLILSLTVFSVVLLCDPAHAQDTIQFSFKSFNLESEKDNVINNSSHLDGFFELLYQQRLHHDRKINILHIGDSHIQADYMTAVLRRNFQKVFGNAGRGFVFPYSVAGTNSPVNFISTSNIKWKSKRCVHPAEPLPIGLGGITISTTDPSADLRVVMNDLWTEQLFNEVTVFFHGDEQSFNFTVSDTASRSVAAPDPAQDRNDGCQTVKFDQPVGAFLLKFARRSDSSSHATLFGFNLQNDSSGVSYHAIGVNGARYMHYNAAGKFAEQTSRLKPDLIIISLGTNESTEFPTPDPALSEHVQKLVNDLSKANPAAKFVLVTPPPAFRNKNRPNSGIETVRNHLIGRSVDNGFSFYDMFLALGGADAPSRWRAKGLLRPDGIHFTKEGYEYQGNLFFDAFMKYYNHYVSLRHP
jgi:lysophospholipase L1-like esterase